MAQPEAKPAYSDETEPPDKFLQLIHSICREDPLYHHSKFHSYFSPYRQTVQLGYILQQLQQNQLLLNQSLPPLTQTEFDKSGQSPDVFSKLLKTDSHPGLLHHLKICAVGGLEGRILAKFGAIAVNIDPVLFDYSCLDTPYIQEIPKNLDRGTATENNNRFNLTLSFKFLDSGSGINTLATLSELYIQLPFKQQDLYMQLCINMENTIYGEMLTHMMDMTKPGGLSIHSGDRVFKALESLAPKSYRLIDQRETDDSTFVTLQKL